MYKKNWKIKGLEVKHRSVLVIFAGYCPVFIILDRMCVRLLLSYNINNNKKKLFNMINRGIDRGLSEWKRMKKGY